MQFKVPQFLDIEDKIFGPFTFSQFVYLAGGAGLCFFLFKLLGFVLGLIPIAIVAGLSLALTFYKPNDKPFIYMLESGFKFLFQDKLYIWKKEEIKKENKIQSRKEREDSVVEEKYAPKLTRSKLKDLAWSLDVLDLKKEGEENK
jgi:hypothetical protein